MIRRNLNPTSEQQGKSVAERVAAALKAQSTTPTGVKDLGEDGDVLWTNTDTSVSTSVREQEAFTSQLSDKLATAQQTLDQAQDDIDQAQKSASDAATQAATAVASASAAATQTSQAKNAATQAAQAALGAQGTANSKTLTLTQSTYPTAAQQLSTTEWIDTAARTYAWTGAAGNSFSTESVNGAVIRTNLIKDPTFEATKNIFVVNGTVSNDSSWSVSGSNSLLLTPTGASTDVYLIFGSYNLSALPLLSLIHI